LPVRKRRCWPASCKEAARHGKGCDVPFGHHGRGKHPLGSAAQGCDSSAGVGVGHRCGTGVTLTGTPQQETGKRRWQQFSPVLKDSHMLHLASSRNHSKASTEEAGILGTQKKKGSKPEPHCAHTKP